jgi:hypothetical protein
MKQLIKILEEMLNLIIVLVSFLFFKINPKIYFLHFKDLLIYVNNKNFELLTKEIPNEIIKPIQDQFINQILFNQIKLSDLNLYLKIVTSNDLKNQFSQFDLIHQNNNNFKSFPILKTSSILNFKVFIIILFIIFIFIIYEYITLANCRTNIWNSHCKSTILAF